MNELMTSPESERGNTDPAGIDLGKWLGRREAFGLVAGRCSAAEVEVMMRIREQKLYREYNCDWEEFCPRQLHASRRSVDREISYLRQYGPAFFTVRQLTRISVREYRTIAANITEQGVNVGGGVIALLPENAAQVGAAVKELLQRVENGQRKPESEPAPFAATLRRCRAVAAQLRSFDGLDPEERLELAKAVAEIRTAAGGLGAVVWDHR